MSTSYELSGWQCHYRGRDRTVEAQGSLCAQGTSRRVFRFLLSFKSANVGWVQAGIGHPLAHLDPVTRRRKVTGTFNCLAACWMCQRANSGQRVSVLGLRRDGTERGR